MMAWRTSKAAVKAARYPFFILVAAVVLAATSGTAEAARANLSWPAPTTNTDGSEITDLAGYKLYFGTSPGSYYNTVDTGNQQSYVLDNLTDGNTYYFAVTAYNTSGVESDYSDEAVKFFPSASEVTPIPPATLPSVVFTVADALTALRHAVGLSQLTPTQQLQYDVAPLGANGTPEPDQAVDVGDAIAILRHAVGLTTW